MSDTEKKDNEISELKKELQYIKQHQAELYKDIADYDEQEQVLIKLIEFNNNEIAKLKKELLIAQDEIAEHEEVEQRIMTLINKHGNSGNIYELVLPVHYREEGWKTGDYNLEDD